MLDIEANNFDPFNSINKIRRRCASKNKKPKYLPPLGSATGETGRILKDVAYKQESIERQATFEHDWLIYDIFDEISAKHNGEKLESELFTLKWTSSGSEVQQGPKQAARHGPLKPIATSSPRKPNSRETNRPIIASARTIKPDNVCEYFASKSKWNLNVTINRDRHKSSKYLSVHAQVYDLTGLGLHRNQTFNVDVTLTLTFHILNTTRDLVFHTQTYEKTFSLKELIKCFRSGERKLVKFGIDRFCGLGELNTWLAQNKSTNFCILSDFKFSRADAVTGGLASTKEALVPTEFKHMWLIDCGLLMTRPDDSFSVHSNDFHLDRQSNELDDDTSTWDRDLGDVDRKIENILKKVKWKLQLYPNGIDAESTGNVSLFLHLDGADDDLKSMDADWIDLSSHHDSGPRVTMENIFANGKVGASFQVAIVDSHGRAIDTCNAVKQTFQLNGAWGYRDYLRVNDLSILRDKYNTSSLRFKCKVQLYYVVNQSEPCLHRISSSKLPLNPIKNPPICHSRPIENDNDQGKQTSLNQDLRHLYTRADMYDLIIQAPATLKKDPNKAPPVQFKVHKLILCTRSQVFERVLTNGTSTVTFGSRPCDLFDIVDFDAPTVDLFLKYLYGDTLELATDDWTQADTDDDDDDSKACECHNKQMASNCSVYTNRLIELIKMSEKYCVHQLKRLCELKLIEVINCTNLIIMLIIAQLYDSSLLKQHCSKYLVDNIGCLVKQKNWSVLYKNYPNLIEEAFRLSCSTSTIRL